MNDFQIELLLIAISAVLIIFICIASICCCYQRRKKKSKIHLEQVSIGHKNIKSFDYYNNNKINNTSLPQKFTNFDINKAAILYNGHTINSELPKKGFSQVFHGSPTLKPKTYLAPPPPTAESLNYIVKDSKDKRSIIVISSYGDLDNNESDENNKDYKSETTNSTNVSPTSRNEKLSLKNRPFKLELAESKVEAAVSAAISPNSLRSFSHSSSVQSSPNSAYNNYLKHTKQNENRSVSPSTKLSPKMEKLQENENEMLYYEFEILNQEAKTSIKPRTTTAELNENIRKNRFYDILPYDFNRVKLIADNENKSRKSNYINASYINIDNLLLSYIAAQGPIGADESRGGQRLNTVADFWQMIWQENINTIVTLTGCVENGRQKCAMYWPEYAGGDNLQVSTDLSISLYCLTENETYFHRELYVYKTGEPFRKIIQWQFKNWKDSSGAQDAYSLLLFLEEIRSSNRQSPILVHCSAGVGRTGVYIALDILLEKLYRENVIDVFETVSRLRESRTNMVQTGEQYLTIYEVIAAAIRKRAVQRNLC